MELGIRDKFERRGSFTALILFAVVALFYSILSYCNGFIYDDHEVIEAQAAPHSVSDVARIFAERHFYNLPYYRPITRTTLLLQKTIHGERPGPFHVFNAVLMGLGAALGYALARRPVFGLGKAEATAVAVLFSIHPVASSCVYPISSGRETLMPAVWILGAMAAHLNGGAKWRGVAILAFTGALLSKEQAVVVPALFVLADLLKLTPDPPGKSVGGWVRRYIALGPILILYFAIRRKLFGGGEFLFGTLWGPPLAAAYALQTIFAPTWELVYEPTLARWPSVPRLILADGATLLLAYLAIRSGKQKRSVAFFWLSWFFLALLPTSNLLRQEAQYDERYIFLSSFAVFALAASLHGEFIPHSRFHSGFDWLGRILAWTCVVISFHRATYFKTDLAFHEQWLHTDPQAFNANLQMGFIRLGENKNDEAIRYFGNAADKLPDSPEALAGLGVGFSRKGERNKAAELFRRAMEVRPEYPDAHFNLGVVLTEMDRIDEAIEQYRLAIRYKPNHANAYYNLGTVLGGKGKMDEAVANYREAARLRPEFADAHFNLANTLINQEKFAEAVESYRRAIELKPDNASFHLNLGVALARLGRFDEAITEFQVAGKLDPGNQDVEYNLKKAVDGKKKSGPKS